MVGPPSGPIYETMLLKPVALSPDPSMVLALGWIKNNLGRLPKTKVLGRLHAGNLRRSKFMATSQNGWSDNFVGRMDDVSFSTILGISTRKFGGCWAAILARPRF
jgi:hypothetical protein